MESANETDALLPKTYKLAAAEADCRNADDDTGAKLTEPDCEAQNDYSTGGKMRSVAGNFDVIGFVSDLRQQFGYKHVWLLFVSQFLNKSFAHGLAGAATPYLYRNMHIPAQDVQIYSGLTSLPWGMKPIFGVVSDLFPICGYNKTPYLFMTTTCGLASLLIIGFNPGLHIALLVGCLFFIQLHCSFADLLTEAKFAQKIRSHPTKGPSLMSFVWGGMLLAGLCCTLINGHVLEYYSPNILFIMATIPAAVMFIPILGNFMEERYVSSRVAAVRRANFLTKDAEVGFLCFLMFGCTLLLIVIPLCTSGENRVTIAAVASLVAAACIITAFSVVLSPAIAKFNTFSLLQTSLSWSHGAAAFYFYTDTEEQYPEGPHLDPNFFNGWMGVSGIMFSLLGIYTYHRFFGNWSYRRLLVFTQLALACFGLADIALFTRFNVRLGIPDKLMLFGMSSSSNIIWQWEWMPQVVLFSQLCPKGMEATMYALLAGAHNLGGVVSQNCGALLLQRLGVTPSGAIGESHMFENLWLASAVGTCFPVLTIALLFKLIPDLKQTDKLLDDSATATSGSLWRQWTSKENTSG